MWSGCQWMGWDYPAGVGQGGSRTGLLGLQPRHLTRQSEHLRADLVIVKTRQYPPGLLALLREEDSQSCLNMKFDTEHAEDGTFSSSERGTESFMEAWSSLSCVSTLRYSSRSTLPYFSCSWLTRISQRSASALACKTLQNKV